MLGLVGRLIPFDKLISIENIPHWGPIKRSLGRGWLSSPTNLETLRAYIKEKGSVIYPEKFHDQFDSVLDFVQPTLEDLILLSKQNEPWDRFMSSLLDWRTAYATAQDNTASGDAYVTLTQEQFESVTPSATLMSHYASIQLVLLHIAARVGQHKTKVDQLFEGIDGINNLHRVGKMVFETLPSCMGRVGDHGNLLLHGLYSLDPPLNCMPSFHISNSFYVKALIDNWNLPDDCESVYDKIRTLTTYMIPCVMQIMQHTASDIAGGLVLAKLMCESLGLEFRDPFSYLEHTGVMTEYSDIPWNLIRRNYDNLLMYVRQEEGDLVAGIRKLYIANGALMTSSGDYKKYLVVENGKTRLVPFNSKKEDLKAA